uniref:Uncharacterized protein n=1 Tax=Anguilla anguilla TaxID=7936 RepID=A0A0E9Q9Z1_ANGAN
MLFYPVKEIKSCHKINYSSTLTTALSRCTESISLPYKVPKMK